MIVVPEILGAALWFKSDIEPTGEENAYARRLEC